MVAPYFYLICLRRWLYESWCMDCVSVQKIEQKYFQSNYNLFNFGLNLFQFQNLMQTMHITQNLKNKYPKTQHIINKKTQQIQKIKMQADPQKLIELLIQKKKNIDDQIRDIVAKSYTKYGMSEVVKDDNPYSRLMALKKMGIVENYAEIKQKTVLIVGVGGIGSVASQMLTRCGIGKLIIYDYDKVQLANMNRLFFTPTQVGMSKVQAAKQTLQLVNPEIQIQAYNMNITTNQGYDHVTDRTLNGGKSKGQVDLVLSCVDNYSARMTINAICNRNNVIWFESGVSESALSGHIQVLVPGETGCFGCASPLAVAEGTEANIKREGVCAASLPTTMGIIAGFLSQAALKYLLNFGILSYCLSYNAQSDFFSSYKIATNPECKQPSCQEIQKKKKLNQAKSLIHLVQREKKDKKPVEHTSNDWGIEIVSTSQQTKQQDKTVKVEESESIEDLMGQLNNL